MVQVCLNGPRTRSECAGLPVSAEELVAAAVGAVAAGAVDIHLHPKDRDGRDSMEPADVGAAVAAVRAAVPGVPVGVTTGAWTLADPRERAARVESWTVVPDHASVNWHEDGAARVADALLARGVGIEAGIYCGTDAADRFLAWPRADRVLRVLAEIVDTDPKTAPGTAERLLDRLTAGTASPILLHGEDGSAWPILRIAAARGLGTRIGLEDTLVLPDGTVAPDNAALVSAALRVIELAR